MTELFFPAIGGLYIKNELFFFKRSSFKNLLCCDYFCYYLTHIHNVKYICTIILVHIPRIFRYYLTHHRFCAQNKVGRIHFTVTVKVAFIVFFDGRCSR